MAPSRTLLLSTLLLLTSLHTNAQVFSVKDLGTLGNNSLGTGINDVGQVVGYYETSDNSAMHAFLWTEATGTEDINPANAAQSLANGVNNFGQIVGEILPKTNPTAMHGILWDRKEGILHLGAGILPYAINDFGQVVGTGGPPGTTGQAFLWTKRTGVEFLGNLGGDVSSAAGINNLGQVVGASLLGGENPGFHAFIWTKEGGMRDLGTLGGDFSSASGINLFGQVAGTSFTSDDDATTSHAFSWNRFRGMQDLGTGGTGKSAGGAVAINVFGNLVGNFCPVPCLSQESVHGFIWTKVTGWLDLNDLIPADSGWVIENVSSVNAWGQITGQGYVNGQYHAFLLTPKFQFGTH